MVDGMTKDMIYGLICLEKEYCYVVFATLTNNGDIKEVISEFTWNLQRYIEETGVRLLEELCRKIRKNYPEYSKLEKIIISMPGTIKENSVVISSSRIGIRKRIDASDFFKEELNVKTYIVHDMDCMVFGAFKDQLYTAEIMAKTLCYIIVDEGVGSTFLIEGKIHQGAGIAGHISRLVVEKRGTYMTELLACGTLEAYVSRPAISKRCIEKYIASLDKKKKSEKSSSDQFRRSMEAISLKDPQGLTCDTINIGVSENDDIAKTVVKEAAEYLGQAINSIITIMHPHEIILSGSIITKIDEFYEQVIAEAEQLSWPSAWNYVTFNKSLDSRTDQLNGAALLATYDNISEII